VWKRLGYQVNLGGRDWVTRLIWVECIIDNVIILGYDYLGGTDSVSGYFG
jgi:hypothetical protein